jgi:hypothetical protein
LVDGVLREGILDNWVTPGGAVFRQIRKIQRKPFPGFVLHQMSSP